MMKTNTYKLMIVLILISIYLFSGLNMGFAQGTPNTPQNMFQDLVAFPDRLSQPPGSNRFSDGEPPLPGLPGDSDRPLTNLDFPVASDVQPTATGGPDDYGYTWDSSIPLAWKDVSSGTDTGMSGESYGQAVGPIALPFGFKFYENVYSQLWITASGYISFTDYSPNWDDQSDIPRSAVPNNVVAPYWTLTNIDVGAWVRYYSSGTAPNRYFVVEWHDVKGGRGDDEQYRFELILYENGDIDFQYQTMNFTGSYWCGVSGIEDSEGLDGLTNNGFCDKATSNQAVRYYRPVPSARVRVKPPNLGRFTFPGGETTYQLDINNIGELGVDTYDLSISSTWPLSLFTNDGITPLTDTDGDAIVDTGPVPQDSTTGIIVKTISPISAVSGDYDAAVLTVTSSLNQSKSRNINIRTAIPAQFAQIFHRSNQWTNSLYLVQPGAQAIKPVAWDGQSGFGLAVAETPGGDMVSMWSRGRCTNNNCDYYVDELEYSIVNKFGETVKPVNRLINHSGVTVNTYDFEPAVVATPDGRVGVAWTRELARYATDHWEYNYNIYFAVLQPSGILAYGPVNLTNNNGWYHSNAQHIPRFWDPRIAGSGDNRFFVAWQRNQRDSSCSSNDCYYYDIYYTIRSSAGGEIKPVTNFTNDTIGSSYEGYFYPGLATLSNNRFLLLWLRDSNDDLNYAVLDSAGSALTSKINLSTDGTSFYDYQSDAAQLSDGRVAVAWSGRANDTYRTRFAILDQNYNRIAGPTFLDNPSALYEEYAVSVSADNAARAVLTWMERDAQINLFYALVNSSGSVITPPMIYLSGQSPDAYIVTSYEGYGNTNYSSAIPVGVDGALLMSPGSIASETPALSTSFGSAPGEAAPVFVRYSNHGQTTATNVVLTMTIDANLTYVSDTSGVVPTIIGNIITWNLPDITFLNESGFTVMLGIPSDAVIGTTYPITVNLAADAESNPADNGYNGEVMASVLVHMPLVNKK